MAKFKFVWKWLRSFFPEKLPQGMTAFDKYVEDVALLSGLPYNNKLKKVTAIFVLQIPPVISSVSKRYVIKQLQKAAANQIAAENLKKIKEQESATKNNDEQKTAQETDRGVVPETKSLGV